MVLEVTAAVFGSSALTYLVSRRIDQAKHDIYVEQAKQKAKAIEHEAELLLEKQKSTLRDKEVALEKVSNEKIESIKDTYIKKREELTLKESEIVAKMNNEQCALESRNALIEQKRKEIEKDYAQVHTLQQDYEKRMSEVWSVIENGSGLTKEEAVEKALEFARSEARVDIANIIRKAETEAKESAKKEAHYLLAQATTRYAGEFSSERLISSVTLSDDEIKGRIIGKEGRNIKALEALMGVDIIVDDTPNTIIVSSFNLYRRAIGTKTLELLIEDGRIQPARIEEIFAKVTEEFEESILHEGEEVILGLGITDMHPELMKLVGKLRYRASYGQNALTHSLEVAHMAGIITAELDGDELLAKRAGILHDIGKSLTHDQEGSHVDLGAEICKRYKEDPVVINGIYAHHDHEDPFTLEAAAVCTGDKLSASRPGARREVMEAFLKRVKEIERIATGKFGVTNAYAISAGREVRVIANAKLVCDNEAILIAKEIAKEIQENVQYPGEIKVNVIRETRAIEMAK
jgi:ribonuclease Y